MGAYKTNESCKYFRQQRYEITTMSMTEIPIGEAMAATKGETKAVSSSMSGRKIIILGSILACVIILAAIGVGVYFATRPENIEVTNSTATETLRTVVKAAKIEESPNGVVTIEYANLLSDRSVVSYYLNIEDFNFAELSLAGASLENLAIYLTQSAEPNVENVGSDPITIRNIAGQNLPYRLQDGFLPGDYNGVLFAVRDSSIDAFSNLELVTSSEFTLIVNPDQNIASPSALPTTSSPSASPTISPIAPPTIAPTAPTPTPSATPSGAPTISPAPSGTATPTTTPSATPSFEPTSSFSPTIDPTKSPTKSPTRAPTPAPTRRAPLPPALTASLSGEYRIGGTLMINYRNDLVNGQIQSVPILEFDIFRLASAPGPYLYLSKRPYSETRRGRLTDDEIFIPIDSVDGGSFSVQGTFEQVLDEIGNVYDLSDYQNGSWVVWCRPFSVWIGGGPIEIV
jgi:hypothetical protein